MEAYVLKSFPVFSNANHKHAASGVGLTEVGVWMFWFCGDIFFSNLTKP